MWSNPAFPSPIRWDTRADDPEVKRLDLNNAPSLTVYTPAIPPLQAALQAFLQYQENNIIQLVQPLLG